jgi:hypothetical protein
MASTDFNNLPPVPYKSLMAGDDGFVSEPWSKWFRQAFKRMGGVDAPTNKDLQASQLPAITALQSQVTSLNSQFSAITTGLGVGPTL